MGKSRKKRQAKRTAGEMDIDAPDQIVSSANGGVEDMDTSEAALKPKTNGVSKKTITKRRSVNLKKKKAVAKAMATSEKQQQKTQQDQAKSVRKSSSKKLY